MLMRKSGLIQRTKLLPALSPLEDRNRAQSVFERTSKTVKICKTGKSPFTKALSMFRDAVAGLGEPWIITPHCEENYSGKYVSLNLEGGGIGLVDVSPAIVERGHNEIVQSTEPDSFCLAHVISGDALVQQSGREALGSNGDILVFNHSEPIKIVQKSPGSFGVLTLVIPKSKFVGVRDVNDLLRNKSIPADHIMRPLLTCLRSLAEQMTLAPPEELAALYDASTVLLPAAARRVASNQFLDERRLAHRYIAQLLRLVDANIEEPRLSAQWVADQVGFSTRHLHRQFALVGITFSGYVMAKRLERVSRSLISEDCRKLAISDIAFRFGFNNLSSFNRAFKKRFGCTPREYSVSG